MVRRSKAQQRWTCHVGRRGDGHKKAPLEDFPAGLFITAQGCKSGGVPGQVRTIISGSRCLLIAAMIEIYLKNKGISEGQKAITKRSLVARWQLHG